MKFLEMVHHFDRPWSLVTFAAWNKYPNENSPQVLHVDVLDRHVDPATGVLHLDAYHRGGSIVIEVSDDGAGLNRERILAKARHLTPLEVPDDVAVEIIPLL